MRWWKRFLGRKEQVAVEQKQKQQHVCDSCAHYMVRFEGPDFECAKRIGRPTNTCKRYKNFQPEREVENANS